MQLTHQPVVFFAILFVSTILNRGGAVEDKQYVRSRSTGEKVRVGAKAHTTGRDMAETPMIASGSFEEPLRRVGSSVGIRGSKLITAPRFSSRQFKQKSSSSNKTSVSKITSSSNKSSVSKITSSSNKSSKFTSDPTTSDPTILPSTSSPTEFPTSSPTTSPSKTPTGLPTSSPTSPPTPRPFFFTPVKKPTPGPTELPSKNPTPGPTESPSENPTPGPSESPSENPTQGPTESPSENPTPGPSSSPSRSPSMSPTGPPTEAEPVLDSNPLEAGPVIVEANYGRQRQVSMKFDYIMEIDKYLPDETVTKVFNSAFNKVLTSVATSDSRRLQESSSVPLNPAENTAICVTEITLFFDGSFSYRCTISLFLPEGLAMNFQAIFLVPEVKKELGKKGAEQKTAAASLDKVQTILTRLQVVLIALAGIFSGVLLVQKSVQALLPASCKKAEEPAAKPTVEPATKPGAKPAASVNTTASPATNQTTSVTVSKPMDATVTSTASSDSASTAVTQALKASEKKTKKVVNLNKVTIDLVKNLSDLSTAISALKPE